MHEVIDGDLAVKYSKNFVRNDDPRQQSRSSMPRAIANCGNSLLRWRAELESKPKSCVIFKPKYLHKSSQNPKDDKEIDEQRYSK